MRWLTSLLKEIILAHADAPIFRREGKGRGEGLNVFFEQVSPKTSRPDAASVAKCSSVLGKMGKEGGREHPARK